MIKKIRTEINKVYFIEQYTLVHILEGEGMIQVDFQNYADWSDKAIYLNKGQYIKFMSDNFIVRFIEFPDDIMFNSNDVRVLFKHLISLGYIDYEECSDCQKFLSEGVFNKESMSFIDISTNQWYWQNPFNATKDEYQVIFDIKDVIDKEYADQINTKSLSAHFSNLDLDIKYLVKNRLGISINNLIHKKQIDEDKKLLAFTDKSIKEIAYDQGFKDPGYFNRFFKNKVGQTPKEFRDNFDYKDRDQFTQDILALIQLYHKEQRNLSFYADKLYISTDTLSKKVSQKMNISLGQLIRQEIISSAKKMLDQHMTVKETSLQLGFEEPNNFSSFFQRYTGISPTSFLK